MYKGCMEIRNCTADDLEQVCRLLAQLWPETEVITPETRRCFAAGLHSTTQRYICAASDAEVVGFCSLNVTNSLWQQGPMGHVDELVVDQRHRGLGIGSALLQHMQGIALEMGCKRLELDSARHRIEAHAFYERLGFENRALLFSKAIVVNDDVPDNSRPGGGRAASDQRSPLGRS
jgi:ribosomal protein S18 acetylase RimI-like enzyme